MKIKPLQLTWKNLWSTIIAAVSYSASVFAHTVIEPPQVTEGVKTQNSLVITHGCGDADVIGTTIVFPDGVDSTIVVNGAPYSGQLSDFLQNWGGNIQLYQDRSVFAEQDVKRDSNGNVTGFWSGGGRPASGHLFSRIPFVTSAVLFQEGSCAKTVRFSAAAADICKITSSASFSEDGVVSFWVPAVGSQYDGTPGGHAYDFPVFFTINRDLATNPLPESCGAGSTVSVKPSAAQLNRDMPIRIDGNQVWPLP